MEIARENPHPYHILEAWAQRLAPRDQALFRRRLSASPEGPSLRRQGRELGVSRETVRKAESRLRQNLNRFIMGEPRGTAPSG